MSSKAGVEIDRPRETTHLIRYNVSASVKLIDGKNRETIKKEDLWEG